ncbi:MAG: hypothetical protein IPL46_17140 [Saprospiraceae bacterium]|nr:hypothetical protein [Saprospiraceae bacterium]
MQSKIVISIIFSSIFLDVQAQLTISPELKADLQNKHKFEDQIQSVKDYYIQKDYPNNPKLLSEYKKWSRWSWYIGNHLDQNGQFVNISERTWNVIRDTTQPRNEANSQHSKARSNSGVWSPIGPYSITQGVGRADRLAFHPTNANIFYAGTPAGGLWRTLNGGADWHPLNGYLSNLGVSGIVVDRDNANILYVLTGDGDSNIPNGLVSGFGYIRPSIGILKSTDGGNSWSKLANIVPPGTTYFGFKLVQSEDFHNRFLLALRTAFTGVQTMAKPGFEIIRLVSTRCMTSSWGRQTLVSSTPAPTKEFTSQPIGEPLLQ